MEFRQLRYYKAVVEVLSFSAAARQLDVAQSAISRQIKALERALGVRLLDRSRSHVRLTPAGAAFYHDARHLLQSADVAVRHAREVARENRGVR